MYIDSLVKISSNENDDVKVVAMERKLNNTAMMRDGFSNILCKDLKKFMELLYPYWKEKYIEEVSKKYVEQVEVDLAKSFAKADNCVDDDEKRFYEKKRVILDSIADLWQKSNILFIEEDIYYLFLNNLNFHLENTHNFDGCEWMIDKIKAKSVSEDELAFIWDSHHSDHRVSNTLLDSIVGWEISYDGRDLNDLRPFWNDVKVVFKLKPSVQQKFEESKQKYFDGVRAYYDNKKSGEYCGD